MQIKIFGKALFEARSQKSDGYFAIGQQQVKESKFLPDFRQAVMDNTLSNWAVITDVAENKGQILAPTPTEPEQKKKTPKEVHELKLLHNEVFKLNTDPEYVDKEILSFKEKLNLIKSEEYDMRNGVNEVASILIRLENRKKYDSVKQYFEEYPYTTSSRIAEVIKDNSYLKIGQVAQFMADMPKEAVSVMKHYNEGTKKLCGKQAVFYIIADKKDFEKTEKRRDPILLAQSPFGHFWQILGAWDKEMLLLEDL